LIVFWNRMIKYSNTLSGWIYAIVSLICILLLQWIVLSLLVMHDDWIVRNRCVLSSTCSLGYRIGGVWGWLRYSGMHGPWRYYTEFLVTPGTIGWLKALLNEYNISGIDAINWRGINVTTELYVTLGSTAA